MTIRFSAFALTALVLSIVPLHCETASVGPKIYDSSAPGVFLLRIYGQKKNRTIDAFTASGFLVGTDGEIATAKHVLIDASNYEKVIITAQSGPDTNKSKVYTLDVVKIDEKYDIAVLKIINPGSNMNALPLRLSSAKPGEPLIVLGYPLGLPSTHFLDGTVGSVDEAAITTNALVDKGNSGGAVLDEKGCVIGIVVEGIESTENGPVHGIKFAVPISSVQKFLSSNALLNKQPRSVANAPNVIHVTDILSRTQTIRDLNYTTKRYHDTIPARSGYIISAIEAVGHNSLNPPDLQYPTPVISADRKKMEFDYSLVSGGFLYDGKRGWIEMTINTLQTRADNAVAGVALPSCE